MQTKNEKWVVYATGSSAGCKVWRSRKERPVVPLLHTLRVYQSVAEGAARRCESGLQGAGLLHQQRWQLVHHPALSHHLHWVKRASQDGAGLLDKFINGWCHRRVIKKKSGVPPALQRTWASSAALLYVAALWSVQSSFVHVNSQVLVRCHHLIVRWWFCWHQSTKSLRSSLCIMKTFCCDLMTINASKVQHHNAVQISQNLCLFISFVCNLAFSIRCWSECPIRSTLRR